MFIRIALCAGFTGFIGAASPAPAPASVAPAVASAPTKLERRSLDELVPSPCLLYVSFDVPAMIEGLSATPLKSSWEDSGLADDWRRAMELLSEAVTEDMTETDFEPSDFAWMLGGEVAFAMGGLDPSTSGSEGKKPFPALVFLADAGERVAELESFMPKFVAMTREDDPVTEEDFRGVTLYTATMDDDEEDEPDLDDGPFADPESICFAQVGSVFMVSFQEEAARNVIRAATGDAQAPALAGHSEYSLIRKRTGNPESMSFYVDVASFVEFARGFMEDDEEREVFDAVVQFVGAAELRGIGGGYSIRADGIWSEMFALNPGTQSGLLWDVFGTSGSATPPSFLPPDVDGFQMVHIDFASLWDKVTQVVDLVTESDPSMPEDPLGDAEAMLGFSIGDLFRSLEGEVTLYSRKAAGAEDPSADMGMMGMGMGLQGADFVVRLRETETLAKALVKIEELADAQGPGGWPFKQSEYLGRVVYVLKDELAGELPISPCFSVTDNLLAFSMTTDNLHAVIRRLGSDAPGLAGNATYQRAAAHLPPRAGYVSYTSAAAVDKYMSQMEAMLEMVGAMASGGGPEGKGLELALEMVPKLRELVGTFDAALGYSRTSPEGCAFTSGWLFKRE